MDRRKGSCRVLASASVFVVGLVCLESHAQTLVAPRDSRQLQSFRAEAEAYNHHDPFANAYRAGHYNGYLAGILDSLQGRSVCFRECVCEVDKLVERYLAERSDAGDRPVVEWLIPMLEAKYPCSK